MQKLRSSWCPGFWGGFGDIKGGSGRVLGSPKLILGSARVHLGAQVGPKLTPGASKLAARASKLAARASKLTQGSSKVAPKVSQDGAKMTVRPNRPPARPPDRLYIQTPDQPLQRPHISSSSSSSSSLREFGSNCRHHEERCALDRSDFNFYVPFGSHASHASHDSRILKINRFQSQTLWKSAPCFKKHH